MLLRNRSSGRVVACGRGKVLGTMPLMRGELEGEGICGHPRAAQDRQLGERGQYEAFSAEGGRGCSEM